MSIIPLHTSARRDDWPERLDAFIRARRARSFAWGQHDCALFAADAVEAMTGNDPAAVFRGGYDSAAGALKAIRAAGHADLLSAVSAGLGEPLPSPLYAQRGDIAAVPLADDMSVAQESASEEGPASSGTGIARAGFPHALGVVLGRQIALVRPGVECLGATSVLAASTAWRI